MGRVERFNIVISSYGKMVFCGVRIKLICDVSWVYGGGIKSFIIVLLWFKWCDNKML